MRRLVALEEHFNVPELAAAIPAEAIRSRGYPAPADSPDSVTAANARLGAMGASRLAAMDEAGITMQVLSWVGPGAELLAPASSAPWARKANDALAGIIAEHPDRYAGFAHLPMTDPTAAAAELSRCVRDLGFVGAMINGATGGRFLDDPAFEPILACAVMLDVPIYLRPGLPPPSVVDAYYSGLPPKLGFLLATNCIGWHAETAIHVLRLVFSGTLERHRNLKIIIGHMGEMLPMMMARATAMAKDEIAKTMSRDVAQQLRDQVWATTSGQFTLPPLMALIETFGIDRVMFSVDYPYAPNSEGRRLMDSLPLSQADIAKIAHVNADKLLGIGART